MLDSRYAIRIRELPKRPVFFFARLPLRYIEINPRQNNNWEVKICTKSLIKKKYKTQNSVSLMKTPNIHSVKMTSTRTMQIQIPGFTVTPAERSPTWDSPPLVDREVRNQFETPSRLPHLSNTIISSREFAILQIKILAITRFCRYLY